MLLKTKDLAESKKEFKWFADSCFEQVCVCTHVEENSRQK